MHGSLIIAPGRIALLAMGSVGLGLMLVILVLLALLKRRGRFWAVGLGVVGLAIFEVTLFAMRYPSVTFRQGQEIVIAHAQFTDDTRFWAFVVQVAAPLVFVSAAWLIVRTAYRRLHEQVPEYVRQGLHHLYQREYNAAVLEFSAAIKIEPQRAELYCKRGTAFEQLHEFDLALSDYERVLARDPNLIEVYLRRGAVRTAVGQLDSALTDFDKVLAIRPNDVECHLQRGFCLAKGGRTHDAVVEFEKVLRLSNNPDLAEPARQSLRELGVVPDHAPNGPVQ